MTHVVHLDLERGWRGGENQVWLLAREVQRRVAAEAPVHDMALPDPRQTVVCRRGEPLERAVAGLPGVGVVPVGHRLQALRRLPRGRGCILHAHTGNTVPLALLGRGVSLVTRRLDLPVAGLLFRRADKVVAVSSSVAATLRAAGVADHRIAVIPDGVDRERVVDAAEGRRLRARLGVEEGQALGLTLASLVAQKDPLTVVRALPSAPAGYAHVWVGEGPLGAQADALARQLGVAERWHRTGFDDDPDRWFAAADVFVLPSVHEGLGSVLLDAFHFGVPVVTTRIAGTADLVGDGSTAELFEPGDPAGLAAAVGRILAEPGRAATMAEQARRRVQRFDIRDVARRYLELYRQLGA